MSVSYSTWAIEMVMPRSFSSGALSIVSKARNSAPPLSERVLVIAAMVPLAQMFGYVTDLRSKTQGRGSYSMEFDHYEVLPQNLADQIINKK